MEQLDAYSAKCSERLDQLGKDRAELWKEIQRRMPEDRRSELKEKRDAMSAEMKQLRKEISLCGNIRERSEAVSPKLEKIYEEEVRGLQEKNRIHTR